MNDLPLCFRCFIDGIEGSRKLLADFGFHLAPGLTEFLVLLRGLGLSWTLRTSGVSWLEYATRISLNILDRRNMSWRYLMLALNVKTKLFLLVIGNTIHLWVTCGPETTSSQRLHLGLLHLWLRVKCKFRTRDAPYCVATSWIQRAAIVFREERRGERWLFLWLNRMLILMRTLNSMWKRLSSTNDASSSMKRWAPTPSIACTLSGAL